MLTHSEHYVTPPLDQQAVETTGQTRERGDVQAIPSGKPVQENKEKRCGKGEKSDREGQALVPVAAKGAADVIQYAFERNDIQHQLQENRSMEGQRQHQCHID